MEYYIHHVPVFVVEPPADLASIREFCIEAEDLLPSSLLHNVEVVYVGNFKELRGRNATYAHGGIYMSNREPTSFDMMENFVHEVAHSLEVAHGPEIYTDDLISEFKSKRHTLYRILEAQGYYINPLLYSFTEYNQKFDEFLADVVGYPTLLTLTMVLFVSPYGATSLQEYFANGFEKYFLDNPRRVRDLSPVLYAKIEEIINDYA